MTDEPDLSGTLLATARALVMTCVLGPATDVAHGDLASEVGDDARAAAAALDRIGWPGEGLGSIVVGDGERTVIRQAALAGLAASAEAVQEAADAGMAGEGAWSGTDAIGEIDVIVALLDVVGWPEQSAPAHRLRLATSSPALDDDVGQNPAAVTSDALAAMHDAFVVIGPDGVIVAACPRFCAMTEFDRDQLVGRPPPYPYWPDENAAWMGEMLTQQLNQARTVEGVAVGRRRSGARFVMREITTPIVAADGHLLCLLMVVFDDRARRRASRALLDGEARFRELADALPVPVWFVSGDGGTVRQNRAGRNAFGVAEITPIGVWWNLVEAGDRARVQGLVEAAMSEERSFSTECCVVVRGIMRAVQVSGRPRRDHDGSYLGYSGTTITVAARPGDGGESPQAITWLSSADGSIDFVSEGAAAFSGATPEILSAGGLPALAHPDEREFAASALRSAHVEERGLELSFRARRNDGAWRRLAISAEPRFADGHFAGLIGSMLDVGEAR